MAFYRLDFDSAPATESDRTTFATNERCFECGSNGPRVSSQFLVPEDSVETLVVEVFDAFPPPLFEVSGLLVAADWIVAELSSEFITGFERRPVTILSGANSDEILGFTWISITGRCTTHPVWHRAMFRCPICRHARTESVTAQHRRVIILPPVPTIASGVACQNVTMF